MTGADPHRWLEDSEAESVLEWVQDQNGRTSAALSGPRFETLCGEALQVLDADDRIPEVTRRGEFLYNFWQDAQHPHGVWRRTTMDQYVLSNPLWDTVIDLDLLAADEGENWVWQGAEALEPECTRALIRLSRAGGDAAVVREFDLNSLEFIQDGFNLPAAKTDISWVDRDTVLIGTDFGPGSLTAAGYPRLIKRWRRGQSLDQAEVVFAGSESDVLVSTQVYRYPGFERTFVHRATDFHNKESYELRDGELIALPLPSSCSFAAHRQWAMLLLLADWTPEPSGSPSYPAGTVLVTDYADLVAGRAQFRVIFEPGGTDSLVAGAFSGERFVSIKLRDVATVVETTTLGSWKTEPLSGVPAHTNTMLRAFDAFGDEIFLRTSSFATPARLLCGSAAGPVRTVKTAPAMFPAEDVMVSQQFATSEDGTRIPYFLVRQRDSDGPRPTILAGYGAFGVPQLPGYLGLLGRLWLTRGGCYAVANIRGGGEFGPGWHTQAVRENRHKVAEDFVAVARDLVSDAVTTPAQLGGLGGSAGGLLMGVMLTQHPDLFGALVSQSPLLDMRSFARLSTGASWIAEFGDPEDPAQWEVLRQYSPYHNIAPETEHRYPPILITSSARDDRVHPGHARKMVAALQAAGQHAWYYETQQGGHSGPVNNQQQAFAAAVVYEFLQKALCQNNISAGMA